MKSVNYFIINQPDVDIRISLLRDDSDDIRNHGFQGMPTPPDHSKGCGGWHFTHESKQLQNRCDIKTLRAVIRHKFVLMFYFDAKEIVYQERGHTNKAKALTTFELLVSSFFTLQ